MTPRHLAFAALIRPSGSLNPSELASFLRSICCFEMITFHLYSLSLTWNQPSWEMKIVPQIKMCQVSGYISVVPGAWCRPGRFVPHISQYVSGAARTPSHPAAIFVLPRHIALAIYDPNSSYTDSRQKNQSHPQPKHQFSMNWMLDPVRLVKLRTWFFVLLSMRQF